MLMAAIEPMEQFLIHKVTWLPSFGFQTPYGYLDLSITNSVLTMIAPRRRSRSSSRLRAGPVVPGRLQAFGEILYDLVDQGLTGAMIGDRGRPFLPYVFALFSLIAVMNIWGIVPGSFTVTSQLAITITLALVTFLMVIVVGFIRNGLGFFKLFVPSGVHWIMLLLVVPIEVVSFLVRPVTLSMRLFGNMIGGHVVLYMFGSFVVGMWVFAMQGGLAYLGVIGSGLSLFMVIAPSALELIVAFLQAFVFAALTRTYQTS